MVNSRESTIYHLVLASKHERATDLFRKISKITYTGQRRMELFERASPDDAYSA